MGSQYPERPQIVPIERCLYPHFRSAVSGFENEDHFPVLYETVPSLVGPFLFSV